MPFSSATTAIIWADGFTGEWLRTVPKSTDAKRKCIGQWTRSYRDGDPSESIAMQADFRENRIWK